jgi:hypothetical protein
LKAGRLPPWLNCPMNPISFLRSPT